MRKILVLFFLLFALNLYGEERTEKLQKIKERVSRFKTQEIKTTTAIAGVRGAEEEREEELYWAGKDSVKKEELENFKIIIEKVEKGDKETAKKDIEIFLIKYPRSALAKDILELLDILKMP